MSTIADLYIQGYELTFEALFVEGYTKVSLPTYPFAKEQYWVDEQDMPAISQSGSTNNLHPLLHTNTSDLSEQRFSTTFTGDEFFLRDHQVQGQKVLPGVAYLEMAQAAINESVGELNNHPIAFSDVVWVRPIMVQASPMTPLFWSR